MQNGRKKRLVKCIVVWDIDLTARRFLLISVVRPANW